MSKHPTAATPPITLLDMEDWAAKVGVSTEGGACVRVEHSMQCILVGVSLDDTPLAGVLLDDTWLVGV